MKRDGAMTKPLKSSFLSCEKDAEMIINKLFVSSRPYSDLLKKLLIINTKDCINESSSNKEKYQNIINQYSLKDIIENKYVTLVPKIQMQEHEEVKSYIVISFDNFIPTDNPEYRDCTVSFDVICHTDYWDLGNFQLRPLKILGYIDGILNGAKLSGIGRFEFAGSSEVIIDEHLSGYTLMYRATHGNDDKIPVEEIN
jgi:hypothetical protein